MKQNKRRPAARLNRFTAVTVAAALCLGLLSGCAGGGETADTPKNTPTEEQLTAVRDELMKQSQTKGLGDITKLEFYEDGERSDAAEMNIAKDNKILYYAGDIKRVVNYPDGYIIDLPQDWAPDFSRSPIRVRYTGEDITLTITVESVFEASAEIQLKKWVNTYILNDSWQDKNRVTQLSLETRNAGEFKAQVIKLKLEDMPEGSQDHYTYVNFYSDTRMEFYHFLFKSTAPVEQLDDIIASFQRIPSKGIAVYNMDFHLSEPENWSKETADLFSRVRNSRTYEFGIFQSNLESTGYNSTIPAFEKRTNYTFPIISQYIHFGKDGGTLPLDFYRRLNEDGRILQLSYQFTDSNNSQLDGYSPMLDIYRGEKDKELRRLARQIKEYGEPIFFRLNNEMSTDWTSYCASCNMADPDIFVDTWVRLYRICEEEGANNMIWIFNPTSESYPPGNWSHFFNYLPPAEYMQMFGLTAYVSGYEKEFPSWKDMYQKCIKANAPFFQDDEWPMCIPEYACGQGDGTRKEEQYAWIEQAFADTHLLPQIKYGVWFSTNDYDPDTGEPVNRFSIDIRDRKLMEAFRRGLSQIKAGE